MKVIKFICFIKYICSLHPLVIHSLSRHFTCVNVYCLRATGLKNQGKLFYLIHRCAASAPIFLIFITEQRREYPIQSSVEGALLLCALCLATYSDNLLCYFFFFASKNLPREHGTRDNMPRRFLLFVSSVSPHWSFRISPLANRNKRVIRSDVTARAAFSTISEWVTKRQSVSGMIEVRSNCCILVYCLSDAPCKITFRITFSGNWDFVDFENSWGKLTENAWNFDRKSVW